MIATNVLIRQPTAVAESSSGAMPVSETQEQKIARAKITLLRSHRDLEEAREHFDRMEDWLEGARRNLERKFRARDEAYWNLVDLEGSA